MPTYLVSALLCVPRADGPTVTWGHRATIVQAPSPEAAKGAAAPGWLTGEHAIRDMDATEITDCPGFVRVTE